MTIVHVLDVAVVFLAASAAVSALLFATLVGLARLEVATVPVARHRIERRHPG